MQARTEVLDAAAHDLRAPVTTILGRADLLRLRLERAPVPAAEWLRTQAAAIRASALRMGSMVEELLDAARLQTGQALDLQVDTLDVGALVQATALPYVSRTGGAAPVHVDAPAGLLVRGDRARLERVVENVIANAVKYSPGGTPVWVTLRPAATTLQIAVRDHGVGIPAADLPHLFTPFFRAATARGIPGIGIGLAGARTIVEQHGGTIAVESAAGAGTTVTITLPRCVPAR